MTCQFTQFFVVLCMLYATSLVLTIVDEDVKRSKVEINAINLTDGIKPEHLKVEEFDKAAVSSDIGQCSTVGKNILKRGGSAVDGAIATLLCLGTVQFPYSGIGGGGFMLVYSREEKKTYGFDYRETVPANLNKKVFENRKKKKEYGGLAVAVPGEVKGFVSAWKRFGKLKWLELVQPSIDIAKEGFKVLEPPTEAGKDSMAKSDSNLRKLLLKQEEPEIIWKSVIKRPDYAKTLEKIRDAPNSMYEGELADIMVSDIKKKGGVMEKSDLKNYQVKMRKPITMKIKDLTLHTLPLPTGGPTVIHTLEICKNFKFSNEDFSTEEKTVLTYHRVLEAIKFANAFRPYFSDPDYPKNKTQLEELFKSILDPEMAKKHFKMIDDEKTHDITYYSKALNARDDHGTAHISVLAENGDAVSATSSLNLKYGAHFLSDTTGILYNDQLGDSYTVDSDEHKFTASEENLPKPFSRPLSAVAPNIIVDDNGDVRMISGGAGGTKVPGSIAWIIMMKFWFGMDFGNSMMAGRLHHCLFPNEVKEYEAFPVKKFIHDGLKKKDHKITVGSDRTVLQAIYREGKDGKIYSKTDPRRHTRAKTDGY